MPTEKIPHAELRARRRSALAATLLALAALSPLAALSQPAQTIKLIVGEIFGAAITG